MLQKLVDAITDMREEESLQLTHELLDAGVSPFDVLEACRKAMDVVGYRFETGDSFLPELILAGEMMSQIAKVLKPRMLQDETTEKLGKIVFGTVEGDIHDIGKDIVVFLLEINGFEVTDLGIDVTARQFVEATQETGAKIVGLSGFLTLAFDPMKETVTALREAIPDVQIMIGGGQIDDNVLRFTKADAYGKDAMEAVTLAKQWGGA